MTAPYRVFIAAEVVSGLRSQHATSRQVLTRFFDELAANPFYPGDFIEYDQFGRSIQVAIIGRFAICYWADHAVKEVKVVDVKTVGS
jgi:hypothetical protein